MQVTGLFCYPVKSFEGMTLASADFDEFGIRWDRRFMLVDVSGHYVTQRKYPILSLFSARIDTAGNGFRLVIETPDRQMLEFALEVFDRPMIVKVWSDEVTAYACQSADIAAISERVGIALDLVYMPESTFRQVSREYFDAVQRVSFADGFPVLLTTEASLQELNQRLDTPVPMRRFRPNLVLDGVLPYGEDEWRQMQAGAMLFDLVKPCSRCVMTTINELGEKGKEPLKTLSTYRKNSMGVCFGQNLVHRTLGRLHLGDRVEILAYTDQ